MKVFIDTNIWLRYVLGKDSAQYKQSQELIEKIESGRLKPYTSAIVLLEVYFVLTNLYKIKRPLVQQFIESLLKTRNLTLIEKTSFTKAWNLHQKTQIKLADCLIASQLPPKTQLCTFDKDFKRLTEVKSFTPLEILKKL
ncbi:hypothetical protein A2160_04730 [Candidatus Beckwithbacteria bacterium RBG_13_42_9]|uniref:PIN domain-containing protein n=1 Tax=Candidatus Beckwithbacteria bacterium RBG_13_42_9 TaxID=1797457 RepID=A0A1F5E5R8_9BACT|nr:MAG: hypothetical protein A2160_04730 [Candidatus Beckwithbacteria bacterium RBG_13_42_9]